MFQKILVCTDGSPYGDAACRYGMMLATALKARLTGLHVLDIRMIEGPALADISGVIGASGYYGGLPQFRALLEAKGNAVDKGFSEMAKNANCDATMKVEIGHPVHVILDQAASADLLILGQRGENEQFGGDLIGSVADRITRRASIPCLITPGRFSPIRMIMAACDGTPISDKVATRSALLARALGASLTVVTVADKFASDVARDIATAAKQTCEAAGCTPDTVVLNGHAGEAILDRIVRDKSDLIVMGAHAHTRIRQWFVGCTSQRIMADSGIPALLVR